VTHASSHPSNTQPPGADARRPDWKRASQIIGTLLSIVLLAALVSQQGWREVLTATRQIPLPAFLLALGLMLLSRLWVVLRWYVLLRAARAPVRFQSVFQLVFIGLFVSNFLPSTIGGDVVRLAGAIALKIDAGLSAASLLVDRLVGMAGMVLMLPAGLSLILSRAAISGGYWLGASAALPDRWRQQVKTWMAQVMSSLRHWLRNPTGLAVAFLATLGHMTCTFLSVSVLLAAMNTPLDYWQVGGLWSISYFVTLLPISINGLGLQEVSISYLYHQFGGVPLENALVLSLVMRLFFVAASLPGALFLPLLSSLIKAGRITAPAQDWQEDHLP
jgi:uncharacterized membrane protein YbhN (UPF0104 family)